MTDSASVESAVLDILAEVLLEPVDELRRHPVMAAYGWDSVAVLEALAYMENRFGITLDLRRYQSALSVDDLVELILAAPTHTPAG